MESGEEELASRLDHYKAKATRHIFLIRHSQYHMDGCLEKDRTLTPLGMCQVSGQLIPTVRFEGVGHGSP